MYAGHRVGSTNTNQNGHQAGLTSTNQNGERTCVEPGDRSGSETTGEDARCRVGESVYLLSHF